MDRELLQIIRTMNPWLDNDGMLSLSSAQYIPRLQTEKLLLPDWDKMWLMLVGPRQAGNSVQ